MPKSANNSIGVNSFHEISSDGDLFPIHVLLKNGTITFDVGLPDSCVILQFLEDWSIINSCNRQVKPWEQSAKREKQLIIISLVKIPPEYLGVN